MPFKPVYHCAACWEEWREDELFVKDGLQFCSEDCVTEYAAEVVKADGDMGMSAEEEEWHEHGQKVTDVL